MRKYLSILLMFGMNFLIAETQSIKDLIGTNFPKDAEGRVYHLGLKKGEVANRILLVGDPDRAKLIASQLDDPENIFTYSSNRGFTTYTGTKNGKPVSIMSIGMGMPMIDFAVREIRAITEGPLYLIRLGSCGTPHEQVSIGTVVVASNSFCITTHHEAYHRDVRSDSVFDHFNISFPLKPSPVLYHKLVLSLLEQSNELFPVIEATDATADSFYGSQGRIDPQFDDRNQELIDTFMSIYPNTSSLQMETYHLFHLAKLHEYTNHKKDPIHVAACAIVLAQRKSDAFLSNERKHELEIAAGNACLKALVQ